MSLIARLTPDNPVLTKELRVRMRGARAYWILLGYLGFLALILVFRYGTWVQNTQFAGASDSSRLGSELFYSMLVTQVFLVLFITPAVTSGAITIEREQQSIDLLTLTPLPRSSIIAGKLLSAVAFTALLVVSSIPMVSICFMLGSIDPAMVVSHYLALLSASFLIGGLGLMWSSIARTTTQAVMYTYATLFVLVVGGAISLGLSQAPNLTGSLTENLMHAVGQVWFGPEFLGIRVIDAVGFDVSSILGGILFSTVAMARLEMWPERRGPLLRTLSLITIAVELISLDLWWLHAWYDRGTRPIMNVTQAPIGALALTAFVLLLLIPTFATGDVSQFDIRNFGQYVASGWTKQGFGRGRLASGIPFLLLLATACLLFYTGGFLLVGHPGDAALSGATTAVKSVSAPVGLISGLIRQSQAPPSTPALPLNDKSYAHAGDLLQAAGVIYATTLGFGLLCVSLSLLFRNRWPAWIVAYVIVIVALIFPEMAHWTATSGTTPNSAIVALYYLNPAQAMAQMADPAHYANGSLMIDGILPFGKTPMWVVTSITWLIIGALSTLIIAFSVRRDRKLFAAIPHEDLVASI